MNTQHTPGPWFIHDEKGRRYVEAAADVVICTVGRWMKEDPNAYLIAAAPDLLNIAELVNAACPDDVKAGDGAVLVALSVEEVLAMRKAIDKAKDPLASRDQQKENE